MLSDIEISQNARKLPIKEVGSSLGIQEDELEFYGKYKAKLSEECLNRLQSKKDGKLVLVTAINPTPAGEGKTTISIGLADALSRMGIKAVLALREPSLGPCFGMKGGAAGGGYAQLVPMEELNLHFTGDFHAITSANNLLAAAIDNHLHFGNSLHIDPTRIVWKRCMDMNDRALRNIVIGTGGKINGPVREDHFVITAASEIMAVLCLAKDKKDLRERLNRMVVAYTYDGEPVKAESLNVVGAMMALLNDAMQPNLIQTLEHTPALVHGGPFANIAHGCNSVRATRTALKLGDVVVTEAGFGADLGAEKFIDIKCRQEGIMPDAAVIVATVQALKYNGNVPKADLKQENVAALKKGMANLGKHIENMKKFGVPVVVAINSFATDTEEETRAIESFCEEMGCEFALCHVFSEGGKGGLELAEKVMHVLENKPSHCTPIYSLEQPLEKKIETVAKEIYGADDVVYSKEAKKSLALLEQQGYGALPVCIAKTQYSMSDNPRLLGKPEHFVITVRDVYVSAGAGFVVVLTGDIIQMPGLPRVPAAEHIDVNEEGKITGLS